MTPFGEKLRALRAERNLQAKDMAAGLGVSPAYLSALEHGQRGRPNRRFVHRVCQYLGVIWDDAEELQRLADLSHPRVTVDTSGLSPQATEFANLLAEKIAELPEDAIARMMAEVEDTEG
jgi:transcriptional regulator with XRE-family HTH domain